MSDESVIKRLEQQTGVLKLSEAIRIGARIRPQSYCDYFSNGASCAIGAAYEAVHGRPATSPEIGGWEARLGIGGAIFSQIIDRNDIGQTREQIADWLQAQGY